MKTCFTRELFLRSLINLVGIVGIYGSIIQKIFMEDLINPLILKESYFHTLNFDLNWFNFNHWDL